MGILKQLLKDDKIVGKENKNSYFKNLFFQFFKKKSKKSKNLKKENKIGVEPYKCHRLEPSKMRFLKGGNFSKKVA